MAQGRAEVARAISGVVSLRAARASLPLIVATTSGTNARVASRAARVSDDAGRRAEDVGRCPDDVRNLPDDVCEVSPPLSARVAAAPPHLAVPSRPLTHLPQRLTDDAPQGRSLSPKGHSLSPQAPPTLPQHLAAVAAEVGGGFRDIAARR
jgi:hypothetical protein